MKQFVIRWQYLSSEIRSKMINSAILGGLVGTIILGISSYHQTHGTALSIVIGGIAGLAIGMGIGILAQIPTNSNHALVRLGYAVIQGASRGALIGAVLQTCALLGELQWVAQDPNFAPSSLTEATAGIGSFANCGAIIGLMFMVIVLMSKTSRENELRDKGYKVAVIVGTGLILCSSLSTIYFLVQYYF